MGCQAPTLDRVRPSTRAHCGKAARWDLWGRCRVTGTSTRQPTLEQREERLGSVDVRRAASIFARPVVDSFMTASELSTDRDIAAPAIGHQRGAQIDIGAHDGVSVL